MKRIAVNLIVTGFAAASLSLPASASASEQLYILRADYSSEGGARSMTVVQMDTQGNIANTWAAPSADPADRITITNHELYGNIVPSVDHSYLAFGGYNAPVGGGSSEADRNVIARFSIANGTFDTTTRIDDNVLIRGLYTIDGSEYWRVGNDDGVHYVEHGASTTTKLSDSGAQMSRLQVADGELFSSRHNRRIYAWGDLPYPGDPGIPLPTVMLDGTDDNARGGIHAFSFFDGQNILFAGDYNRDPGAINVFEWNATEEQYDILTGANQELIVGYTPDFVLSPLAKPSDDVITLFYTDQTIENDNALWSVTWDTNTKTFNEPTKIADAGEGYSFIGVAAIPEPGTIGLLFGAFAMSAVLLHRRFRS